MKTRKLIIGLFTMLIFTGSVLAQSAIAGPQSATYEIKDYTFGAGGTEATGVDSATYTIFGTAGEVEYGKLTSGTYGVGTGLAFTLKANVPGTPTLTNPATNYDRLKIVIDKGGNPDDTLYAVAISDDSFVTTQYVKSDFTVGSTLAIDDWLPYDTGGANWGGGSGVFIRTLRSGTTYQVKVAARRGNFTQSGYSLTDDATTSNSSLTFSLDNPSITFTSLNAGNSYTDSGESTIMTTSTNAYSGYSVYGRENQQLKTPENNPIYDYLGTNDTPTTWTGTGFGYTTSDSTLGGLGGANRFAGATKYAGFTTAGPGEIVADNPGPVQDPTIFEEDTTISYRVTVDATTPAGTYSNIILYTIVPTF